MAQAIPARAQAESSDRMAREDMLIETHGVVAGSAREMALAKGRAG